MFLRQFCLLLLSVILLTACSKDEVETVDQSTDTTATLLYSGVFMSDAHDTNGMVSILKATDDKFLLRMQDLKSDNGPDLRLYLADDKKASNSIELASKPKNGTYDLVIPSNIDFKKQRYVLIWCKQFSVLFGSAELK